MSFVHPEVLVSTDWVLANLKNPEVRIVEVDVDPKLYKAGHIPGAVGLDWNTDLQDQVTRDIPSPQAFASLLSKNGVRNDHTVVLYGDSSNWFAAYAFWLFKLYGHADVRLMDGGRAKWLNEADKPLTPDATPVAATTYRVDRADDTLRARLTDVIAIARTRGENLVDVRSPDEFTGKVIAPPGMTETAQRAGHVPGAKNIPWAQTVRPDGTFKSADELRTLYFTNAGISQDKDTVTYCRIGERSSHSWFVLKYLLGLKNVRNYDGSWTEYGSVIGAPIEKGA